MDVKSPVYGNKHLAIATDRSSAGAVDWDGEFLLVINPLTPIAIWVQL